MNEFYDSGEFSKLPDEFNRDYKGAAKPVQKKKDFLYLLSSFVAVFLLIFPLTITGSGHHVNPSPDPGPGPDPGPSPNPPDGGEEYEIVGQWNCDNEYYQFFEDGTGFWTDGELFVLLNWEESGNDYRVYGEGMFVLSQKVMSYGRIDMLTIYDNGQLYLERRSEDYSYLLDYFSPSEHSFDLTNITPLFGKEGKDCFVGEWVFESALEGPDDGKYVFLSFIQISEDGSTFFDFASFVSDRWEGYELPWVYGDDWPNIKIIVGDGTRMYFEEFPAPNTTYTYETYEIHIYRFIDVDGEGIVATGMNQSILRKYVWEEPSGN